jgi:hypothetical protein
MILGTCGCAFFYTVVCFVITLCCSLVYGYQYFEETYYLQGLCALQMEAVCWYPSTKLRGSITHKNSVDLHCCEWPEILSKYLFAVWYITTDGFLER